MKNNRGDFIVNFKQLSDHFKPYLSSILTEISPGGKLDGREYTAGNIYGGPGDSFRFNIDTQKWADFADANCACGDIISLYAAVKNIKQIKAAQELAEQYGFKTENQITTNVPSAILRYSGKQEPTEQELKTLLFGGEK